MYRPVWRSGAGAPPAAPGSSLAAMSLKTRVPEGRRDAYPSVPGRCRLLRDERFPSGACGANRSRTARSSPQGAGAKGREANARPKEHKWAVRQDVGGECASKHEAQEPLAAFCRAQRRERKEQTLTRGDPAAERRWEVSRSHSSVGGTHEQKGVPMRRAEGPNRANHGAGSDDERTNEAAGRDNCGRDPGLANDWPKAEGPQPVGVFGVTGLRAWEGRPLDGPTAGCGKPHVRWCGRVPGRNPRHPTRSRFQLGGEVLAQERVGVHRVARGPSNAFGFGSRWLRGPRRR